MTRVPRVRDELQSDLGWALRVVLHAYLWVNVGRSGPRKIDFWPERLVPGFKDWPGRRGWLVCRDLATAGYGPTCCDAR